MEQNNFSIDTTQLINRLAHYPCFHGIPENAITTLINQGSHLTFQTKEIIVHQDEWVDSIFLIISGKAEVSIHKLSKFHKAKFIPIAELHAGEVIGLNENGFYSSSGKRTATVTSIDLVHVIKIELNSLQNLFEQYPQHHDLHDAAYRFLKMKLIKEALPFINISHERLIDLSNKIQDRLLHQGEFVFHEHDIGNECYLIVEGEVSICRNKNGETNELATLKSPSVFGEATLITNEPRNASAIAKTNCKLLMIKKNDLTELLETQQHIEETFMTLMINRSCPIKNPYVEEYIQKNKDCSIATIIKQPKNSCYVKLSEEGTFIWNQMNGENSLKDITINHCKQFKLFAPQTVTGLISKLARSGFIENLNFSAPTDTPQTFSHKYGKKIAGLLNYRKSFGDVNQWISKTYSYIRFLYRKEIALLLLLFGITGIFVFLFHSNSIIQLFERKKIDLLALTMLIPLSLFSVVMHELGHAFSVKHYKRNVHYIGIAWNFFMPSAFTDTSDMWLAEKKPRTIVNLSGIFSDLVVSSIAAWLITITASSTIQAILWLFCLFTYLSAFKNLNPLSESDGYYILVDWLERPKLKESSLLWLGNLFQKKNITKKVQPELIYWLLCLFFLFGVIVITLFVQNFFLKLLGLPESNPFFVLIIPITTMLITAVSAFRNRKKAKIVF